MKLKYIILFIFLNFKQVHSSTVQYITGVLFLFFFIIYFPIYFILTRLIPRPSPSVRMLLPPEGGGGKRKSKHTLSFPACRTIFFSEGAEFHFSCGAESQLARDGREEKNGTPS